MRDILCHVVWPVLVAVAAVLVINYLWTEVWTR